LRAPHESATVQGLEIFRPLAEFRIEGGECLIEFLLAKIDEAHRHLHRLEIGFHRLHLLAVAERRLQAARLSSRAAAGAAKSSGASTTA
ncbi:MAG TPA: hypothetical protein VMG55_16155, partial [Stellaceae bacterium]|nr:hypothetical protein [Stellaceae bacterium]